LFLGLFGAHRFYVKKLGTGLAMLFTIGGFGLWTLFDLVSIVNNKFEDEEGHILVFSKHPTRMTKKAFVIGSILAWVALFFAGIVALVLYFTSGLVDVFHLQLNALREGDIKKAYSYTSKDFQHVVPIEQFNVFIEQYPSLKNNKSTTFNEREIKNNTGRLKGTLTAIDGAKTPIEIRFIKEDDIWKILSIRVNPIGIKIEEEEATPSSTQEEPTGTQSS
jgi:hypothetical protein